MTTPSPARDKRVSMQFIYTALAEGLLLIGVMLFFILKPQTELTVIGAAVSFALGLILAVFAIYKAVPLMAEPITRLVGYLSIGLIVTGPIMLYVVSLLL